MRRSWVLAAIHFHGLVSAYGAQRQKRGGLGGRPDVCRQARARSSGSCGDRSTQGRSLPRRPVSAYGAQRRSGKCSEGAGRVPTGTQPKKRQLRRWKHAGKACHYLQWSIVNGQWSIQQCWPCVSVGGYKARERRKAFGFAALVDPGSYLLSRDLSSDYHRRTNVSLPGSGWDRVGPLGCDHQASTGGFGVVPAACLMIFAGFYIILCSVQGFERLGRLTYARFRWGCFLGFRK